MSSNSVCSVILEKDDSAFIKKLKKAMKETRGNELPRFMSYQVCQDQIMELVIQFQQPARKCLNEACKQLRLIYNKVVDLALGKYHDLADNIKVCHSLSIMIFTKDFYLFIIIFFYFL